MTGEDSSYQAYTARKASKLRRPNLDCGCPKDGVVYGHLWCDRLACRDHADDVHDCSAFGGAKDGTGKESEPAEAAAEPGGQTDEEFLEALAAPSVRTLEMYSFGPVLNAPHPAWTWTDITEYATCSTPEVWRAANPALPYRCRGCRLWIAQDVKLCGPCSALPSCLAERFSAEWGGLAACFRPDGHDGQHESVQGRCWMDPPALVEVEGHMEVRREGPWTIIDETHIWRAAADPRAEVAVATPEEAAEHTRTMETRSLECSRSRPMCSGCDGAAAWGSSPCLHDCHDADALPADAASDPDPVAPRRRLTDLYTALKVRRARRGGAK